MTIGGLLPPICEASSEAATAACVMARSFPQGVSWPAVRQSTASASPGDFLLAVPVCPERVVALGAFAAAKKGRAKKRIDVFPDDLSFSGNFEEAAEGRFGDERIAVWQALGVAHARR